MKLYQIKFKALLIIGLFLSLVGCRSQIFEDLRNCPQGTNFRFYSQTPCGDTPTYPADMNTADIFVFNEKGILVEHYRQTGIALSKDYEMKSSFYKVGTYSFVAWGGADKPYSFSAFEKNKTTKEQLLLKLNREAGVVTTQPHQLYFGTAGPIKIEDRSQMGSVFDTITFNMQPITNVIKLTITGLLNISDCKIYIKDNNGIYNFDGDFAPDQYIQYNSDLTADNGVATAEFKIMKLAKNRNAKLFILNKKTNKELYSVNIVEGLIMNSSMGVPPYKLECDHLFKISLALKDKPSGDTYMAIKAIVNDWTVFINPIIL